MTDELPRLLMYAIVAASLLYHLPRNAGGWTGLWHPRIRRPVLFGLFALAISQVGIWLADGASGSVLDRDSATVGGILVLLGSVAAVAGLLMAIRAITTRKADATRYADALDLLLDPTDTSFVVDDSNAHRPLELLDELSQLIGPGRYAPGQPWATHQWIAERMPAARAVKPNPPELRIEKSIS